MEASTERRSAKISGAILTIFTVNTPPPKGASPLPAKNDAGTQERRMTNKTVGRRDEKSYAFVSLFLVERRIRFRIAAVSLAVSHRCSKPFSWAIWAIAIRARR